MSQPDDDVTLPATGEGGRNDATFARETPPSRIRVDVAHSARIYDYILGGKTNYPADREAAEKLLSAFPITRVAAQQNRAFVGRAVRYLAEKHGIDQFLDIGTGIPTSPNLHEIAQAVRPSSRVVYVDNDPIVLAHARALLTSSAAGRTAYLEANLTKPTDILASPMFTETLDPSRPLALSLVAVLHFVPDDAQPAAVLRRLVDELAVGSFLVISHGTSDFVPNGSQRAVEVYRQQKISMQVRSLAEIEALLPPGLELVEPGITLLHRWRPDVDPDQFVDTDIPIYGLIAKKV